MRPCKFLPSPPWLACQRTFLFVLLPISVLPLNITGSVSNGNVAVYTNRTWVISPGTRGILLSCSSDKGVWSYQNGSDVPGVGQGVGHAVHQVVPNGSRGATHRDLVFTGRFTKDVQGFYQCSQPRGESVHVAVFLKGGLAPRNLRIVLESFPTARLMWDHPEVGVAPVTSYNITTVYPPGRPVKTVGKHSDWWRFDTRPDQEGAGDLQFELQVSAKYGQFLETAQIELVVLPPPTNLTGSPVLQRGAVQLNWSPVNAVISGYQIKLRKSNSALFSTYHSLIQGDTSVVIGNLAVGERYDFQVKAKVERTDIVMQSFPSNAVAVETYSEPTAPNMVTISALSLSRITVAWQPPSSLGGLPLLRYHLYVSDEPPLLLPPTNHSHTLEDLGPDTAYIISVAAENALGVGSQSDPVAVVPRQLLGGSPSSVPLEIIVPVVTVGLLIAVICVVSVLFYATIHKRRDQFKQQLTKISNTLTRERSGRSRTRETPPISRPLPLPPGHEMTPNPCTSQPTDPAYHQGAVNLHPVHSFHVPRTCALQGHSDTMTTSATYVGESQLNFAAAHPGRQPPPLPSRGGMLQHTSSFTSRDETCSTEEYEQLDPETLAELNPGYQKLRHRQCYEALRTPTAMSVDSVTNADGDSLSGTVDLNTAENNTVPVQELVTPRVKPHPHPTGVGVAKWPQMQDTPPEGVVAAYSYEKPVTTKKHKKRRRPPSQPPPPPPSAAGARPGV